MPPTPKPIFSSDLSGIGNIDLSTRLPTESEWFAALPTTTNSLDAILSSYPTLAKGEDSVPIHTRVPASWLTIINQIREKPGTLLPNIFPTLSDFFRWCIMRGMHEAYQIAKELDAEGRLSEPMSPILRAMIFLEQEGGEVTARTNTMLAASLQVEEIAKAADLMVRLNEIPEAVDLINTWLAGAAQQDSPFWRAYIYKLLVTNDTMRPHLRQIILGGFIHDEYLLELAEQFGVMDLDGSSQFNAVPQTRGVFRSDGSADE